MVDMVDKSRLNKKLKRLGKPKHRLEGIPYTIRHGICPMCQSTVLRVYGSRDILMCDMCGHEMKNVNVMYRRGYRGNG
jgi:predicted amidophosphoribosyltransferase